MLSALALQLAVLGLAVGMMQSALRRRPDGGLFAALPLGLLPPLLMSAVFFMQVHGASSPEMDALRADWMRRWSELLPAAGEDAALAEALKAEFMALGRQFFGAMPAFYFCFQAAALAAIAAWLRKRQARLGLAPKPTPLAQWTAPLGLVWLVLAPVFWFFGGQQGILKGPSWASALALNLLIAGLALYLFQGAVILGAKLLAWSRDPATRALTPLVLGAVILSLVLLNGQGLVVFLILTGLFDPWIDLRRLQAKPGDGKAAS
jgi:hypothetical protein